MPIARLEKVSLAYGLRPLLDQVALEVESGERVCLVGRNGEGKSSLLRLLSREIEPDAGGVWIRPGARVAHLEQDVAMDSPESVFSVVAAGLPKLGRAIAEFHAVSAELERSESSAAVQKLAAVQHEIEAADGWRFDQAIKTVLTRLELDGAKTMRELSGGWRRRVLLARALVSEPDLLLLDEPTNHLDIDAIMWLEEFIAEYRGALLFVSHDRAFVRRLATRVVDLDRGKLTSWPGNYDDFVQRKTEALQVEAEHQALFDKKLAQEEVWIRKGIEARRTRNEGRVRALYALREERRARRERVGTVNLQSQETEASGKLVFEAEHASYSYGDRMIFKDFSVRIMRGDRIGIMGPNGAGKTTLIKVLLGELLPTAGTVRQGTRLAIAYFDQQRQQLDPDKSVMENVAGTGDTVEINGQRRHVSGYLRDFIFAPERLNSPVSMLSGGERNRLLLAKLFAQPANLLVLDEPTNDLDIETLDLLEELIANFPGTLLVVSHDREFLDHVVTSTLVFEGDARVREYVGGYSDWVRQRPDTKRSAPTPEKKSSTPVQTSSKRRKLSYKDQRELDALPEMIADLEREQATLQAQVSDGAFYQKPREEVAAVLERLQAVGTDIEAAMYRWEQLESLAAATT